jgi:hypothetical protein
VVGCWVITTATAAPAAMVIDWLVLKLDTAAGAVAA